MDEQELKGNEKPKELEYAEQLINETKFAEAYQVLSEFDENQKIPIYYRVLGSLLQCRISMWQGNYLDCYKIAERAYKESLGLEKNLITVEALGIMSLSLIILREFNKGIELVQKAENLLKTFPKESSPRYTLIEALIAQNKGYYHIWSFKNIEVGLRYLEESLSLRKRYGGKVEIAMGFYGVGNVLSRFKGELDHAIEYLKQGLTFASESGNKWPVIMILSLLGNSYSLKGELDRAIEYYKNGLKVAKEINNTSLIINFLNDIGNLYMEKGELDLALDYLGQSMVICEEIGDEIDMVSLLGSAIELSLVKDDYERAQQYFRRLEQLNVQFNIKITKLNSLFYNALLLKASPRFRNKIRAEEKFRQILEEENLSYSFEVSTLIHLSDLLLTELRVTNEVEVLQEVKPLITRLLEVAENSNSYWVLCEAYLLKAKLALLTKDIKSARQFLTQAQGIAEKHDLNLLAMKISDEHDELLKQLSMWEKLKDTDISIDQLMKEVRLDDQMKSMVKKHVVEPKVPQNEQPVLLTIISKEGYMVFSNPFTADMTFDADSIGDFLSSFNTLSDQIFYENLDRVKFIDYTILMKALDSLTISYIFKGKSYLAQQKLTHFFEALNNHTKIIKTLNSAIQNKQILGIKEIPSIEELITESFLSDPQNFQVPFKAYEGDKPFLFVSYAHVDKLHVYPIIDYLNKTRINIWYDEGIPISENWKKVIVENIEKCKAFLVFITPQILNSDYVQKEINFALKRQKPFFPVYLKETKLPGELEFEISDLQHLNKYLMPESEFYDKLQKELSSLLC